MWTYMVAAARGDRVNSMMSSRRRGNETESPKYGYNRTRPMYRTTRLSNSTGAAAASNGAQFAGDAGHFGAGRATATQMFHTDGAATTTSAAAALAAADGRDVLGSTLHQQRIRLKPSHSDEALIGEEEGGSLYAPFTPSTSLNTDKDSGIFNCKDTTVCMVRKHLIANQSGETAADAIHTPMHNGDVELNEHTSVVVGGGVGGSCSGAQRTRRYCRGQQQQQQQQQQLQQLQRRQYQHHHHQQHQHRNCKCTTGDCRKRQTNQGQADSLDTGDDYNDDVDDDDDADEDDDDDENDDVDVDESIANEESLERGKKLSQDQRKHTKTSALRRTLSALRQRLTKRNRAKPPDWFLEKFSNSANTDKIGKTANDATLASEIRGTSVLCNRLSVNTTLQSHYRWLSIVSLAVLYNIIFVVGRAVFWELNRTASGMWFFFDYLCDFIYLIDMLVHMHEGYLDQGLLVRDAYKLRRHYFSAQGWYLDVLSMLPTDLAYFWWPGECSSLSLPCPVIVRLNRLLRLPRLLEWFDRTETATGYPNAFRICKVVLAILVLIHWNACMYFAISYSLGFSSDNWVYNLNGTRNNTLQRQYIYSFYWSTLTLTTIGETPTPENDAEYLFVVCDFLAGVLIFATIVGNIGSMISNMNVARVEFQNRMDGVKQYMAFRKVGNELEARVIRWFAYTWSQSGALDEERVLAALPDKLKAEIAIQVHMDTLKQVRIFHDTEPGLLEALVLKLKLQVFSPGDYICRKGDVGKEMYIVKRGKLSVVGDDGITVLATLGAGSVFGEVSVLEIAGNRTGNRRTANVRSLGYSDLFCLAKRDLWETLADYPEARSTLTERGCQLLRKDGLLDEEVFSDSQRVHDSIESGIEKLEGSVENLNMRLARLLAEYTASQAKIKQRLAKLEFNAQPGHATDGGELQTRGRSGRLYSLQPKKRPRPRPASAAKTGDNKQNTL